MRVLDLFSGIGGFSLGLERAGFTTVAFCEIEPFCQAVLRKHWPNIPIYRDIRTLTAERLAADGIEAIDVICGGFPCQDISVAGKGAGINGSRSGLWSEYARLIGEIRPRYVIVENVAALLVRGMDRVIGDLATLWYDAEWRIISAADVGAPHLRKRVWIVAYPNSDGAMGVRRERDCNDQERHDAKEIQERKDILSWVDATGCIEILAYSEYSDGARFGQHGRKVLSDEKSIRLSGSGSAVANAGIKQPDRWRDWTCGWEREPEETLRYSRRGGRQETWMSIPESLLGRVADGIPSRVDKLRGLGNAVVPQIPEIIGKAIMRSEVA